MTLLNSESCENEALMHAARLMLLSARTAPKSGGVDDVLTAIALGKEKDSIADEMDKIAEERKIAGFKRDAKNVRPPVSKESSVPKG